MTDTMTNPTTNQEPDFWHRVGITTDGIYEGLIKGVSAFGYAVDAVDNAPRILNVLPGEQGFGTISGGDPFMGHDHIERNLRSLYESYNDLAGVEVPEPVDLTDHALHLGGQVAGGLAVAGGTHTAIQSSAAATNALKVTGAFATTVQDSSWMNFGINAGRSILNGAWTVAKLPYQATKLAFGAAATGTAVIGTGAAVDLGLNDGDFSEAVVRKGVSMAAEYGGNAIESALGIPDLSKAFNNAMPEGVKNTFEDIMEFMGEHNELAKWGSFAATLLVSNAMLKGILGDSMMSGITSLAIASMLAWGASEMFEEKAVSYAEAAPEKQPQNIAAPATPTTAPAFAM